MPKEQNMSDPGKSVRAVKRVEFSKVAIRQSDSEYLEVLRDLGVGEQTARFMLGFRNGTVTGDALIPDPDVPE